MVYWFIAILVGILAIIVIVAIEVRKSREERRCKLARRRETNAKFQLLTNMGAAGVKDLVRLLEEPDHWTKLAAVRHLGKIDDPIAKEALINVLGDSNSVVAEVAADILAETSLQPMLGALIATVQDATDSQVILGAVRALGTIGDPKSLGVITQTALSTPDLEVYRAALEAIAEIGGPSAVHSLAQIANSPDADLTEPLQGLAKIGGKAAVICPQNMYHSLC